MSFQMTVSQTKTHYQVTITTSDDEINEIPIHFSIEKEKNNFELDLKRIFTEARDFLLALETVRTFRGSDQEFKVFKRDT